MSKLKLQLSAGGHLGRIHAKLASANQQFEFVAVADPSPTSQQLVTQQLGVNVVADYRDLIGKIDGAVIATPTTSHYEVTSALLRAGVHCLVEKPLATTGPIKLVAWFKSPEATLECFKSATLSDSIPNGLQPFLN